MNTDLTRLRKHLSRRGAKRQLAQDMGIREQSVAEWLQRGYVPGPRVVEVAKLTRIPRHLLNASVFPARAKRVAHPEG